MESNPSNELESTVSDAFFKPLKEAFVTANVARKCIEFPDLDFLILGVRRSLDVFQSGRHFIQYAREQILNAIKRSNYFEQHKSKRRASMVKAVAQRLFLALLPRCRGQDVMAVFDEVKDWELWAGDGTWFAAATHDPKSRKGKRVPKGSFFGIDLRTQLCRLIDISRPKAGNEKEADISLIKRSDFKKLRSQGMKHAMWIWDRAAIDFSFWQKAKKTAGVYFISRAKKKMLLETVGVRAFDRNDPVNQGVISDEYIRTDSGVMIRMVIYQDPETQKTYKLLTTEMTFRPGLIAHLYRLRWNIERLFYQFKHKMEEDKSWGSSPVARQLQALFLEIAHNLNIVFKNQLSQEHGIQDSKVTKKYQNWIDRREDRAKEEGRTVHPLCRILYRSFEVSSQYLRWLNQQLAIPVALSVALESLRPLMEHYL